ncbi:GNAT family N-acetyltransferase [Pinisolibacter sp.]|uniref:GNAT family N-acetyltransferase n=1 Tax=Pinisolibacter sp. TaxID=2172024 RepID=UPI002FDD1C13
MGDDVRLIRVGPAERAAVEALRLAEDQTDLVASNVDSLAEADEDADARPRAVAAAGRIVGFLMYELFDGGRAANIYRFMIDRAEQGRGYGRAALARLLDEIAAEPGVEQIEICYMPENAGARRLYAAAGFVEVGVDEDGEIIARRAVDRGARPVSPDGTTRR